MKYILTLLTVLMMDRAISQEQWFCTDDSAERRGNTVLICGVGTHYQEGAARKQAMEYSVDEFQRMCSLSSDCKDHKIDVIPKRSTCIEKHGNYICHRMFQFTIN